MIRRLASAPGSYGAAPALVARGERRGVSPRKLGCSPGLRNARPRSSPGASKRTPHPGGDPPSLLTLESNSHKRQRTESPTPRGLEASGERRRLVERSAPPPASQGEEAKRKRGRVNPGPWSRWRWLGVPPRTLEKPAEGWCFVRGGTPNHRPRIPRSPSNPHPSQQ